MTESALLEALQKAQQVRVGGQGMRVEEICAAIGKGPILVRGMIRAGLAAGTVRRTTRVIECLDGRTRVVPSYMPVRRK